MHALDEVLIHAGVKGMKWGVRKDDHPHSTREKGAIKKRLDSLKRERAWSQYVRKMDEMSTKDIQFVAKRVSLENSLKRLSKSDVGTKKDREEYFQRHTMSNDELSRKINRLQAKLTLHDSVQKATETQRELGNKITNIAGSIGVKYAIAKSKNKKLDANDLFEVISKPNESADKAHKDLVNEINKKNPNAGFIVDQILSQTRPKSKKKN